MMPREQALDAALVTRLNLKEQLLAVYPQLAEDEQALLDTLDGLDSFNDQIIAVLRAAVEREAMGKALGELIDGMTARKHRLEDGAKNLRSAALHAMQEAGVPKIVAPDMSASVSPGKPKLVILDEDRIPETLMRVKREPDKKAIAEWLAEIDPMSVPSWVTWGNPQPYLTLHRK